MCRGLYRLLAPRTQHCTGILPRGVRPTALNLPGTACTLSTGRRTCIKPMLRSKSCPRGRWCTLPSSPIYVCWRDTARTARLHIHIRRCTCRRRSCPLASLSLPHTQHTTAHRRNRHNQRGRRRQRCPLASLSLPDRTSTGTRRRPWKICPPRSPHSCRGARSVVCHPRRQCTLLRQRLRL